MGEDSKKSGGRFADPVPQWRRFRPLKDGEAPIHSEGALEEDWSKEGESDTPVKRRWSLIWVGILALGVLLGVGVIAFKNSEQADVIPEGPAYRSVAERRAMVGEQLAEFLRSTTTEDRLAHILEPDRLRPMLVEFYSRENTSAIELEKVVTFKALELEGQRWVWLQFSDQDGVLHAAAFKETEDGFKLDWESLVAYGELSWEELVKRQPREPTQMRVYLRRSDYFNWKYQDREKYVALEIEPRDGGKSLYGYVERGSEVHAALAHAVPAKARQPANISLHFEDDAGAENLVVIDKLIHTRWLAPSILGAE